MQCSTHNIYYLKLHYLASDDLSRACCISDASSRWIRKDSRVQEEVGHSIGVEDTVPEVHAAIETLQTTLTFNK